jgi:hypothetical protein
LDGKVNPGILRGDVGSIPIRLKKLGFERRRRKKKRKREGWVVGVDETRDRKGKEKRERESE